MPRVRLALDVDCPDGSGRFLKTVTLDAVPLKGQTLGVIANRFGTPEMMVATRVILLEHTEINDRCGSVVDVRFTQNKCLCEFTADILKCGGWSKAEAGVP